MKLVIFLLYNKLFIYQVLCTLIYRRRSLYSFLMNHTDTYEIWWTYVSKCLEQLLGLKNVVWSKNLVVPWIKKYHYMDQWRFASHIPWRTCWKSGDDNPVCVPWTLGVWMRGRHTWVPWGRVKAIVNGAEIGQTGVRLALTKNVTNCVTPRWP